MRVRHRPSNAVRRHLDGLGDRSDRRRFRGLWRRGRFRVRSGRRIFGSRRRGGRGRGRRHGRGGDGRRRSAYGCRLGGRRRHRRGRRRRRRVESGVRRILPSTGAFLISHGLPRRIGTVRFRAPLRRSALVTPTEWVNCFLLAASAWPVALGVVPAVCCLASFDAAIGRLCGQRSAAIRYKS